MMTSRNQPRNEQGRAGSPEADRLGAMDHLEMMEGHHMDQTERHLDDGAEADPEEFRGQWR